MQNFHPFYNLSKAPKSAKKTFFQLTAYSLIEMYDTKREELKKFIQAIQDIPEALCAYHSNHSIHSYDLNLICEFPGYMYNEYGIYPKYGEFPTTPDGELISDVTLYYVPEEVLKIFSTPELENYYPLEISQISPRQRVHLAIRDPSAKIIYFNQRIPSYSDIVKIIFEEKPKAQRYRGLYREEQENPRINFLLETTSSYIEENEAENSKMKFLIHTGILNKRATKSLR